MNTVLVIHVAPVLTHDWKSASIPVHGLGDHSVGNFLLEDEGQRYPAFTPNTLFQSDFLYPSQHESSCKSKWEIANDVGIGQRFFIPFCGNFTWKNILHVECEDIFVVEFYLSIRKFIDLLKIIYIIQIIFIFIRLST